MRLLLLASEFPPGPGGIGTHAAAVAAGLAARQWNVVVSAPQDYATDDEIAEYNAQQPYRVAAPLRQGDRVRRSTARITSAVTAFHRHRPHVVLASGAAAVRLAALLPASVRVSVAHGSEVAAGGVTRRLNRRAFARSDAIICVSEYTQSFVHELLGAKATAATVIHNGADAERYQPSAMSRATTRARYQFRDSQVLLTVGSVSERKGQDIVVQALALLRDRGVDAVYVTAGRELEPGSLSTLGAALGVADRLRVLGPVAAAELPGLYNASDVYVTTSRRTSDGDVEGFGIAAIEAALCAKPAVVAGGSGLAEAVDHGVTGIVVPSDDPTATATAIERLLSDPKMYGEMSEAARTRALNGFRWDAVVERYDQVLRRLAGEKTGSPCG